MARTISEAPLDHWRTTRAGRIESFDRKSKTYTVVYDDDEEKEVGIVFDGDASLRWPGRAAAAEVIELSSDSEASRMDTREDRPEDAATRGGSVRGGGKGSRPRRAAGLEAARRLRTPSKQPAATKRVTAARTPQAPESEPEQPAKKRAKKAKAIAISSPAAAQAAPSATSSASIAKWAAAAEPAMRAFAASELPSAEDSAYVNDQAAFVWPPHAARGGDPSEAAGLRRGLSEYNRCRLQRVLSERARAEAAVGQGGKKVSQRPDTKAIEDTKKSGLCTRIRDEAEARKKGWTALAYGAVVGSMHGDGVRVGQAFWSRAELSVCGMHFPPVAGIDTATVNTAGEQVLKVATSLVVGGNYEDNSDASAKAGEIVYTGSGGCDLLGNKKQVADQTLDTPVNRALANCVAVKTPVRLVRKNKCAASYSGNVFMYDGLWDVVEHWDEKGVSGFKVIKYRLRRREGQPSLDHVQTLAEEKKLAEERREGRQRVADANRAIKEETKSALRRERDEQRTAVRTEKVAAKEAAKTARAEERERVRVEREKEKAEKCEARTNAKEAARAEKAAAKVAARTASAPPPPIDPPLKQLPAMPAADAASAQSAALVAHFAAQFGKALGFPAEAASASLLQSSTALRLQVARLAVLEACQLLEWWGAVDFSEALARRWVAAARAEGAWPEALRRVLIARPLAGATMEAPPKSAGDMDDAYWADRSARTAAAAVRLGCGAWEDVSAGEQLAVLEALCEELCDLPSVRETIGDRAGKLADKEVEWRRAEREGVRQIKCAAATAREALLAAVTDEAEDDVGAEGAGGDDGEEEGGAQDDALARQKAAKAACAKKAALRGEFQRQVRAAIEEVKAERAQEDAARSSEQTKLRSALSVRDAPLGVDREGSRYWLLAAPGGDRPVVVVESAQQGRLAALGTPGSDEVAERTRELGPGAMDRALFATLTALAEGEGAEGARRQPLRSATPTERISCSWKAVAGALREALKMGAEALRRLPSGTDADEAKAALICAKRALGAATKEATPTLGVHRDAALSIERALSAIATDKPPDVEKIAVHMQLTLEEYGLPPLDVGEGPPDDGSSPVEPPLVVGAYDVFELSVVEQKHLPELAAARPLWRCACEGDAWRADVRRAKAPHALAFELATLLGRARAVLSAKGKTR